ncbi:MFS transporter [Planotetraspora sp. A-T 1434]|uniref:MFS transporter n=1 Tax=Planotetraspora sp. A-T 1434 TaxID=2979219 RepID=UPI0021BE5D73|nr:MFS transporter [Planotetraspora sp. A-T 1434]MCT9934144.1 MFS transporter [Planotetraspora sp. A-T 1434]
MTQRQGERATAEKYIVRRFLQSEGASAFGDGLWFSMWAIYLTAIQGIPPTQMGLAMGLGGALGLLLALPVGALADRLGAREILLAVTMLRAAFSFVFVVVGNFWTLLVVAALFVSMETAAKGVKVTAIHHLMPPDRRLTVLAQTRVVQHLLYAAGAGAAAWVLSTTTAWPYHGAVVVNGLTFIVAAAIMVGLPRVPPVPAGRRAAGTAAVRDLPYVAIMSSTAILALCWALLSSGLPLWLQRESAAPVWIAPLAVLASSLMIALFQVRVTRNGGRLVGAVRSSWRSGFALAACCLVFAAAAWPANPWLAAAVVVIGLGLHVVGELYYVAARWGLSLKLMAKDAEGQYQSVTATTEGAVVALGPAIVTTLVTGAHTAGWVLLAVLFLTCSLPVAPLCRRLLRQTARRPAL